MRSKAKRPTGPGTWKYTVGRRPHTVTAYERPDKRNIVWLRWNRPGTGYFEKLSLGMSVRDENGRLIDEQVQEAEKRARNAYDRLLRGESPRAPEPKVDAAGRVQLTIEEGLARALRFPEGMFAVEDDHARDMRRYQRYLLRAIEPGMTWMELSKDSYNQIWRKLARLMAIENFGGKRTLELCIVLLAQAGRWLHDANLLERAPATPKKGYAAVLTTDWYKITNESHSDEARPRHTPEEVGRLHLHLDHPEVDPRLRLAFRLGAEARLGQALTHCKREHLDLRPIGVFRMGRFTIPNVGKKKGVCVDLSPDMRKAVDHELSEGYLKVLEARYQAGRLESYFLFAGGRLVRGVALGDGSAPIGDRAATNLWHEFEKIAGVAIIENRGWYGVRRTGADLAEDVETDGRALNAITGHDSDEMRRKIYQEKIRNAVLGRAATAREAARQLAIEAAIAAGDTASQNGTDTSTWERKQAEKRARRAAAHAQQRKEGRRRPTYPTKACERCGVEFQPTGANTRACAACSPRRVRPKPAQA